MTEKEIYEIYATKDAKWTNWVRPVPFVGIDTYNRKSTRILVERNLVSIKTYEENTAIFIDLPSIESIEAGIALAKLGYRPIPIFNGTDEQENSPSTTPAYLTEEGLISGALKLKNINIEIDANPAFLLDSNRLNRYRKTESIFDNSWDLYGQDIPSYNYFKENGINKIIVVGDKINKDLRKIFFKFQDNGITFYQTDGYSPIKKQILKKTLKEKLEKEEL